MLKKEIEEAINKQINAELYSSYLYYSMSAWFESISLTGFAHWMKAQALEEMTHVQKFFDYVNDRGGRVKLMPIEAPQSDWDSPQAAFETTLDHEVSVTGMVNSLVDLAMKNSDHATTNFLQWFVGEQVEEEAGVDAILQKVKLVDNSQGGLFMLDQELGQRPFAIPPEISAGAAK